MQRLSRQSQTEVLGGATEIIGAARVCCSLTHSAREKKLSLSSLSDETPNRKNPAKLDLGVPTTFGECHVGTRIWQLAAKAQITSYSGLLPDPS